MRNAERFGFKWLAGFIAAVTLCAAAQSRADQIPQTIRVLNVEGKARYSTDGNKTWHNLHKGDVLKPGTVIQTAEKSIVDVVLADANATGLTSVATTASISASSSAGGGGGGGGGGDSGEQAGNVIRLFESTSLSVDKLTVDRTGTDEVSDTQLDLRAGQIMGNVKKLSKQSTYEIRIPNGVAGIRGTGYLISSTGVIDVLSGAVIVSELLPGSTTPITAEVPAGYSFDPQTGKVTKIPEDEWQQLLKRRNECLEPIFHGPEEFREGRHGPIIYISPVDGQPGGGNNQGQNNNNQGNG